MKHKMTGTRLLVIKFLFQLLSKDGAEGLKTEAETLKEDFSLFVNSFQESDDEHTDNVHDIKTCLLAEGIIKNIFSSSTELIKLIEDASSRAVPKMDTINLSILLLASYELRESKELSVNLIIDEALGLAKTYATTDSAPFINGVLDKIAKTVR